MEERCSKAVSVDGWHRHQCTRKVALMFEGKSYCAQHDPVRVAKKQADKTAKWEADWAAKKATWRWDAAAHALCVGVSTEQLERLGANWLGKTLLEMAKSLETQ
jgi:hypothetical protein